MKYSIKKGQQNEFNLFVDGTQSICPYVQPIPMQGNMGQVQLHRLPCTNVCPLADYNGIDMWTVCCGGEKRSFRVEEELTSEVLHIVK